MKLRRRIFATSEAFLSCSVKTTGMEIIGAVIGLLSCLCAEIDKKYNNLKHSRKNMETLRRKMEEVSGKEDDVKTQLQRVDKQQGMKPRREVQIWLDQIENLKNEVGSIVLKEKLGCLNGVLCCYYSELKLAKRVEEHIKTMHDLIRDMAINITRVSPLFMVEAGVGLKELPKVEWTEDVERISLMNNNIQVLLESLSNLENLCALLLHYCYDLKTVPPVTNLKSLRFLDLYYTGIEVLPPGIEGLVNLRHLNLSHTFSLNILPIGVIHNLSLLEDLYMYRSKYRWSWNSLQVEGGASMEEIINSTHLANLNVHLVDLPSFDVYVKSGHWQELRSFHLIVGQGSGLLPPDGKYIVEIEGCHIVNSENPLVLPFKTQHLAIKNCSDVVGLSELQCLSHLNDLKECRVFRCNKIEYILMEENTTLTTLETLDLWDLPKLTSICKGVVQYDTLKCLKILKVNGCHSLKNLFSIELLHHLQNIKEIQVKNCMMMEELIAGAEENVALPRLSILELEHLPNLKSIFYVAFMYDSLQTICIMNCPKLKELPFLIGRSPLALKAIKGSRKWWNALTWSDPHNKIILEQFFEEEEDAGDDDSSNDDNDDEIHSS
ncbi:hypothetical protein MRB53_030698 [Persea americana]|uniref:Uncharacterized protein n=1 Tax=Persea americana TaxID=3435 RepID=A0ACC2KMI6_PERAE|nr:hypothetical protein MRB53_030698 [Persea americana]